jgi:hypothetical protein
MGTIFLTLEDRLNENFEFSKILEKVQNNKLFEEKKIIDKMGLYNFIYGPLVDDMKLFLNDQKNELDETTKYTLHTIFVEIYPPEYNPLTKKMERPNIELPFDKDFVVFYLNVLNNMKDLLSDKTNGVFEYDEMLNQDEQQAIEDEILNQDALFSEMMHIIAENAYKSIEQMKALKQNKVQKVEIETLSTQKKIPEDVQNIISGFAANQIKGGRKSKRRGLNKKGKTVKKKRSK